MRIVTNSTDFYNEMDAMVYTSGYEECEPDHAYGPAVRKSYMIHYITYGEGVFKVHDHTYHLKKGDAFLIRPGEVIYYQADHDDPWQYAWIGMQGVQISHYLKRTQLVHSPIIHYDQDDALTFLYLAVNRAYHLPLSIRDLSLNSALYRFLAFLVEKFPNNTVKTNEDYVENIMKYCLVHLDQPIKVEDIARHFGLNRSYISRLFKEKTQMSLKSYLILIKMTEAKRLLKETDLPIGVIALSLGYEDALYFSRVFKQHVSLSPLGYRQQFNENVMKNR